LLIFRILKLNYENICEVGRKLQKSLSSWIPVIEQLCWVETVWLHVCYVTTKGFLVGVLSPESRFG
jgi:hypothetical protein